MKTGIELTLKHSALAVAAITVLAGTAPAQITIANGDLESTTGDPATQTPVAPNWGGGTQAAGVTRFAAGRTSPEPLGEWFAFTRNSSQQNPRYAEQTLAAVFEANTKYTLSSLITHNGSTPDLVYEIGYLDGGSVFQVLGTATFDQNPYTTEWVRTEGATYSTGTAGTELGEAITIRLRSNGPGGSGGVWFDNVTLEAVALAGEGPKLKITAFTKSGDTATVDLALSGAALTRYEFRSSTDLNFNPGTLVENLIEGTPPVGTIEGPNDSVIRTDENGNAALRMNLAGPRNFIRAQIPAPLFSVDFEEDNGGFIPSGDWQWGDPDSNNGVDLEIVTGNPDTGNCWATNLGLSDQGFVTPSTDSILRSPDINLTGVFGAQLRFAAAVDAAAADTLEVLVREVGTDNLLDTISPVVLPNTSNWTTRGPFDLSAADDKNIYLEFRFQGTDANHIGFYLDDVVIE